MRPILFLLYKLTMAVVLKKIICFLKKLKQGQNYFYYNLKHCPTKKELNCFLRNKLKQGHIIFYCFSIKNVILQSVNGCRSLADGR